MICNACPRKCNIDRTINHGVCGVKNNIVIAKIIENFMWEEPCISNKKGALAIFFSGCNLRCDFCQNYEISHIIKGKEYTPEEFKNLILSYNLKNYSCIDLITPTQFTIQIYNALNGVKLPIPVVWNSSGYENVEQIKLISKIVDVFMPDFKFYSKELSYKLSKAEDYFEKTLKAIIQMKKEKPNNIFKDGVLNQGLLIRHLILPGYTEDSKIILKSIKENINNPLISIMCQFTPTEKSSIKRSLYPLEYKIVLNYAQKIGLTEGYYQDLESANKNFIPDF